MSEMTSQSRPSTELPGEPVPYVQEAGSGRAHLLLGQVGRTLVGAEETGGAMSVMTCTGPAGRPIPLHFHEAELEVFLCTHGRVQLYAGDQSRVLVPGDLGVVPARTLHAFQFHSAYSQFMGRSRPAGGTASSTSPARRSPPQRSRRSIPARRRSRSSAAPRPSSR